MLTYREPLKEGQVSFLHVNGFHSLKEHKLSGGINPPSHVTRPVNSTDNLVPWSTHGGETSLLQSRLGGVDLSHKRGDRGCCKRRSHTPSSGDSIRNAVAVLKGGSGSWERVWTCRA